MKKDSFPFCTTHVSVYLRVSRSNSKRLLFHSNDNNMISRAHARARREREREIPLSRATLQSRASEINEIGSHLLAKLCILTLPRPFPLASRASPCWRFDHQLCSRFCRVARASGARQPTHSRSLVRSLGISALASRRVCAIMQRDATQRTCRRAFDRIR